MTTQDQNKKTLRHFQCRDYLWEVFEQMSTELECSTDYLINEAMRQYARSRNYGTASTTSTAPLQEEGSYASPAARSGGGPTGSNGIPSLQDSMARRSAAPSQPPVSAAGPAAALPRAPTGPTLSGSPQSSPNLNTLPAPQRRPPMPGAPSMPPPPPPPRPRQSAPPPAPPMVSNPPPVPAAARVPQPPQPPAQQQAQARPRQLFIIFNGQKIPVQKEEFVIGRGSKSADLAIKDGNISRRHAAVVFHNGAYYLKDLGSTNGVEFQGRRFDSKRIEEGDVFRICDYELRFSYQ
jgi:neural Wiskott-Aldrich syndrome protein